jgi:hypothetical protein
VSGRTLYLDDFDAEKRTLTNFNAFASEKGKPVWVASSSWIKDLPIGHKLTGS